MYYPDINITETDLAKYSLLKEYSNAWRILDITSLNEILTKDVAYDAPGVPFDIIGREKVLDAHSLWFENLKDENIRRYKKEEDKQTSSSYNILTQLYPYASKFIMPYMELSYFVDDGFLKIYYFNIMLDKLSTSISRIETRHIKLLVPTQYIEEYPWEFDQDDDSPFD